MSPLFHLWEFGSVKFGLTFMARHDALIFTQKMQKAIEHLFAQNKSSKIFLV